MANEIRKAEIVPDISLMKKIASISGTIPSRIMELIDNAIDAKVENKTLTVEINIVKDKDQQYIEVIDNGHGMTEEEAKNFFKLAESQKDEKTNIGKFGLGAKVAILGLGNTAEISTTPMNENYSVYIDFDINKFEDWSINYTIKSDKKKNHGTKIHIDHITVRLGDINKLVARIEEHVSKTYKHFIEQEKVVIKINGNKVSPHIVDLVEDYYQTFDFMINGKRVHGWAGAMKKAGTNWKFGFDLIKNGRIIKTNDLLSRQAHTSLARLVGEIHLDEFRTDVHKTDFLRDTEDFQEMQDYLVNHELTNLLANISKITNRDIFAKYEGGLAQISSRLNKIINSSDFLNQIDVGETLFSKSKMENNKQKAAYTAETNESDFKNANDDIDEKEEKQKRERKENQPRIGFNIQEPNLVSMGENSDAKKWRIETDENGTNLVIDINLDHPTYKNEEEVETYIKNAVIDSVSEFIVKEEKKNNDMIEDDLDRFNTIKDILVRQSA